MMGLWDLALRGNVSIATLTREAVEAWAKFHFFCAQKYLAYPTLPLHPIFAQLPRLAHFILLPNVGNAITIKHRYRTLIW